jgi:hypothetical protein
MSRGQSRGNNQATDCLTTCRLTGDRKMRAAYLCRSQERPLDERSGGYFRDWPRRCSNIRPSLLVLRQGYLKIYDERMHNIRARRGVTPQHVRWRVVATLLLNLMATDELKVNRTDNIY